MKTTMKMAMLRVVVVTMALIQMVPAMLMPCAGVMGCAIRP
jgi:hypothetical protein